MSVDKGNPGALPSLLRSQDSMRMYSSHIRNQIRRKRLKKASWMRSTWMTTMMY
jgi:hypothetical protein